MLIKSHCYLAAPDDMLEFEKTLAAEFFMQTCCRKVDVKPECLLLAPAEEEYIAVARTCRMFVLSYIQAGNIKNRLYLENHDYSIPELIAYLASLTDGRDPEGLPVYFSGRTWMVIADLACLWNQRPFCRTI